MIGAGLFAVFAPAAATAGWGLLLGLAIAGGIAWCNATSSAQLAAQYPVAGGSYVYGRERLGPWPGFLAGWGFMVGKTGSCAAMALTVASYLAPSGWQRPVAVLAVVALATVNVFGISRTAALARVIVAVVLVLLAVAVGAALLGRQTGWQWPTVAAVTAAGPYGVLQSAGLLFFAFAGYARVATLGEEVIAPRRTIPRAITVSLGIVAVLYLAVAVVLLVVLGPEGTARTPSPVAEAVTVSAVPGLAWAARIGAGVAALGALLALVAGLGRTGLAMAREGDLPRVLAAVHPRFATPYRMEVLVAVVVLVLVLLVDLREVIGFSSFGVLLYYLVANASAYTQTGEHRRYPRVGQVVGVVGCAVLVATLPWPSVVGGVAVFAVGVVGRLVARRVTS